MEITLLYSTPHYHKLVEYAARRCYASFDKCNLDSHKLVRSILGKGHLSVSGHGNIVLGFSSIDDNEEYGILDSLVTFKEINNYIRWSRDKSSRFDIVVSFNILTFTDVQKFMESGSGEAQPHTSIDTINLYLKIKDKLREIPALRWFLDKDYIIEGSENPFLSSDTDLLKPTVLSSDYAALTDAGLTDYELDVHSTITVEIVSDRAMSLQDARHSDMMCRSEISQRYVSMKDFRYRIPEGLSNDDVIYTELGGALEIKYSDILETIAISYDKLMDYAKAAGNGKLRAQEIARSILPNNTYTTYIDTRPLKQWKHLIHLRDDKHAQNEKQKDTQSLIKAFRDVGISV